MCSSDDVELVDIVEMDSSKKIWHCSNILQSAMIRKAVVAVYEAAVNGAAVNGNPWYSAVPEWLSCCEAVELATSKAAKNQHIQFLGLVSLHQNKSGTSVIAFRLHTFVLYSYDDKAQSTKVHLLINDNTVFQSSASERIIQILQMIQGDQVNSSSLTIAPNFVVMDNLASAYHNLGFSSEPSSENADWTVFVRKSVLRLAKFTNRVVWGRFGRYLSFQDECHASPAKVNLFCRKVT